MINSHALENSAISKVELGSMSLQRDADLTICIPPQFFGFRVPHSKHTWSSQLDWNRFLLHFYYSRHMVFVKHSTIQLMQCGVVMGHFVFGVVVSQQIRKQQSAAVSSSLEGCFKAFLPFFSVHYLHYFHRLAINSYKLQLPSEV